MDIYFVTIGKRIEKEALKEVKPQNILLSYFYWKNKKLEDLIDYLGYKPNIMIDSGAFSASNREKNVNLLDYIEYIKKNENLISEYVTLDVIGKPKTTYLFYKVMKEEGLNPIPCYHYGEKEKWLDKYAKENNRIVLGNTVPIQNKKMVAGWVNGITKKYPNHSFHLLGSSSKKILRGCPRLDSCDSSTYFKMAIFGKPKKVKGKKNKAIYNIKESLEIKEKPKYEQMSMMQ